MATRGQKAPRTSAKDSTKSPKTSRKAVPAHIKAIVWGQAAGRCQFTGCNERLIGDLISGKTHLNKAYIAHIVADSADGPRGDAVLSPKLTHDPANLMLMCDPHHRLIDGPETRLDYPVERLREMKARHERRIEIVTGIDEDRACHVIRYTAGIAANEAHVAAEHVRSAMLPDLYPADGGWINLDVVGLNLPDHAISAGISSCARTIGALPIGQTHLSARSASRRPRSPVTASGRSVFRAKGGYSRKAATSGSSLTRQCRHPTGFTGRS